MIRRPSPASCRIQRARSSAAAVFDALRNPGRIRSQRHALQGGIAFEQPVVVALDHRRPHRKMVATAHDRLLRAHFPQRLHHVRNDGLQHLLMRDVVVHVIPQRARYLHVRRSRTAPVDEEGEQLLALAALEMHRHVACVHLESPERLHAHKRSFGRRSAFSRMGDLALQVLDGNWLEDVPVRMDPERVDGVIGIPRDEHDGASGGTARARARQAPTRRNLAS